jgi:hypothetical protein
VQTSEYGNCDWIRDGSSTGIISSDQFVLPTLERRRRRQRPYVNLVACIGLIWNDGDLGKKVDMIRMEGLLL